MQERCRRRWAGVLFLLLVLAAAAGNNGVVQHFPKYHAVVNWETRVVIVHGYAPVRKNATASELRRAKEAAARNARQNLLGVATIIVPITGDQKRRQAMANDVLRAAAAGKLSGKKLEDGRYQVTLQVVLAGKSGLMGALAKHLRSAPPARLLVVASRAELPPTGEEDLLTPSDAKGPFTGLIVDARGLGIQTSMSPVIYDAQNQKVYAGEFANIDFVLEVGVVGYATTIKAALTTPRVGKNPLILRAIGSPDEFHRCVSVSEGDAERIRTADKAAGFLKKCAVTLVIDPQAP